MSGVVKVLFWPQCGGCLLWWMSVRWMLYNQNICLPFLRPQKNNIFFFHGYGKRRCSSTFFWCACPLKTLIRSYFFCFGNGGERMSKGAQASHGTLSWLAGVTPSDLRLNRWGTIFSLRDRQTRHQFFKKDKSRFGLWWKPLCHEYPMYSLAPGYNCNSCQPVNKTQSTYLNKNLNLKLNLHTIVQFSLTSDARFPKCLANIFAKQARWWKFGFSSALKLNRLSGLTDRGSNIKSEKRSLSASFLFSPILKHYYWSLING